MYETREEIDLDLIETLLKFRWKITKKEEVGYNTQSSLYGIKVVYTLVRNKSIMNYNKIFELENEYFRLKDFIQKNKKVFKPLVVFLFLLGIIPGILYLLSNKAVNKKINKNNNNAKARMKNIIEEVYVL